MEILLLSQDTAYCNMLYHLASYSGEKYVVVNSTWHCELSQGCLQGKLKCWSAEFLRYIMKVSLGTGENSGCPYCHHGNCCQLIDLEDSLLVLHVSFISRASITFLLFCFVLARGDGVFLRKWWFIF